ncbi:DUF5818 domain-containing protein [Novosphingobium sp. PASSN1]|uniref:DUF5818 domain-containing protein n=1 Tax=Novosphingobium sp. PASSN1 TaxID=2015561 RepID=UPI0025CCAD1A|nr:DUF5818 domain-containing protein [Novosphingobium sp. PASSN1]
MEHLTGTIQHGPNGLVLEADGGGMWELDNTRAARRLVGSHVEVVGQRAGFNGLVCDQIRVAGQIRPQAFKLRLEFLAIGALVAYGLYATVATAISAFG